MTQAIENAAAGQQAASFRKDQRIDVVKSKPSICFVAHHAYGTVAGCDTGHIGGIERQQALMARWLVARGYAVSVITWAEGPPGDECFEGVRVVKTCAQDAGMPVVRFLHPRWSSLNHAMERAGADVYYYNCGDLGLGQVVLWCRRHRRRSVYSVASEPDCRRELPVLKPWRERMLYRYGLRHVDHIVAQTRTQAALLKDGFARDAEILPMPCELSSAAEAPALPVGDGRTPRILWIGRIDRLKRFDWLVQVAQMLPECIVDVVGDATHDSEYANTYKQKARSLPNVEMHGRVRHEDVWAYYSKAHVLCCTSAREGLPNTFLEAWSHGLPVVTTFDPDGVVDQYGLGRVANSVEEVVTGIRQVLEQPTTWEAVSAAAKRYVWEHHELDTAMKRFEALFLRVSSS